MIIIISMWFFRCCNFFTLNPEIHLSSRTDLVLTRISTLYFKSSGDGRIDGSLFGNGFVSKRSSIEHLISLSPSIAFLPPRMVFKILAICFCCLSEQWFSIFKITGYLKQVRGMNASVWWGKTSRWCFEKIRFDHLNDRFECTVLDKGMGVRDNRSVIPIVAIQFNRSTAHL